MQDINWFSEVFYSLEPWGYLGPIGLVIIGYVLSKKDKILGVFWFIVECLFAAHYFELVDATPQYWWHIFLILLGGLFTCVFPLINQRKS